MSAPYAPTNWRTIEIPAPQRDDLRTTYVTTLGRLNKALEVDGWNRMHGLDWDPNLSIAAFCERVNFKEVSQEIERRQKQKLSTGTGLICSEFLEILGEITKNSSKPGTAHARLAFDLSGRAEDCKAVQFAFENGGLYGGLTALARMTREVGGSVFLSPRGDEVFFNICWQGKKQSFWIPFVPQAPDGARIDIPFQ